jgi:hypothetical protein
MGKYHGAVERGRLAPLVLELRLPFGHASFIAIGGGADGECDVPKEQSLSTGGASAMGGTPGARPPSGGECERSELEHRRCEGGSIPPSPHTGWLSSKAPTARASRSSPAPRGRGSAWRYYLENRVSVVAEKWQMRETRGNSRASAFSNTFPLGKPLFV